MLTANLSDRTLLPVYSVCCLKKVKPQAKPDEILAISNPSPDALPNPTRPSLHPKEAEALIQVQDLATLAPSRSKPWAVIRKRKVQVP